jgi:hypothetical protein
MDGYNIFKKVRGGCCRGRRLVEKPRGKSEMAVWSSAIDLL